MSINMLEHLVPVDGMEPVGEIRLLPDPGTFSVLPWVPASAVLLCDQVGHDRHNWGACPRTYLKDVIGRAAAHGILVRAAFENEYYLAREEDDRFIPFDVPGHAPVYSSIGHDLTAEIMIETIAALETQGMVVEQAINEYGPGQQEISVGHTGAGQDDREDRGGAAVPGHTTSGRRPFGLRECRSFRVLPVPPSRCAGCLPWSREPD